MKEISQDVRDLVREDLSSLAELLHKKFGMSVSEIRSFLKEMLDCSI